MSHDIPPWRRSAQPYNGPTSWYAAPIMINVSEGRLSRIWRPGNGRAGRTCIRRRAAPLTATSRLPERRAPAVSQFRRSTGRTAVSRIISALALQNAGSSTHGLGDLRARRKNPPWTRPATWTSSGRTSRC